MKKTILLKLSIFLFCFHYSYAIMAQVTTDTVKTEITEVLKQLNTACNNADLNQMMSLFDDNENIILIGSDSGEIFKGKTQIREWLGGFFDFMSCTWDMDRIDMDYMDNTAWVFVDGYMNYRPKTGEIWKRHYRFTLIMVKKADVWKLRLFDGSKPKYKKP